MLMKSKRLIFAVGFDLTSSLLNSGVVFVRTCGYLVVFISQMRVSESSLENVKPLDSDALVQYSCVSKMVCWISRRVFERRWTARK